MRIWPDALSVGFLRVCSDQSFLNLLVAIRRVVPKLPSPRIPRCFVFTTWSHVCSLIPDRPVICGVCLRRVRCGIFAEKPPLVIETTANDNSTEDIALVRQADRILDASFQVQLGAMTTTHCYALAFILAGLERCSWCFHATVEPQYCTVSERAVRGSFATVR
jgi:hypothetical protein